MEANLFERAGWDYARSREILEDGCEIPPSFEGFRYMLEQAREQSTTAITPQTMAARIAATYRRIR